MAPTSPARRASEAVKARKNGAVGRKKEGESEKRRRDEAIRAKSTGSGHAHALVHAHRNDHPDDTEKTVWIGEQKPPEVEEIVETITTIGRTSGEEGLPRTKGTEESIAIEIYRLKQGEQEIHPQGQAEQEPRISTPHGKTINIKMVAVNVATRLTRETIETGGDGKEAIRGEETDTESACMHTQGWMLRVMQSRLLREHVRDSCMPCSIVGFEQDVNLISSDITHPNIDAHCTSAACNLYNGARAWQQCIAHPCSCSS